MACQTVGDNGVIKEKNPRLYRKLAIGVFYTNCVNGILDQQIALPLQLNERYGIDPSQCLETLL